MQGNPEDRVSKKKSVRAVMQGERSAGTEKSKFKTSLMRKGSSARDKGQASGSWKM